ncbi:MAG: hypothetical protein Q4F95_08565 [Oscillospiraceae bacterium]|nr:hypothetical protein [Oscillospiraceae bacterium]
MITIKVEDHAFVIKGTFDFGYIGTYTNEQIEILDNLNDVRTWDLVTSGLDAQSASDDQIAELLEKHYNKLEHKINENIISVNNNFLLNIISDMVACGSEFWDCDEITIKEFMPSDPQTQVYQPKWGIIEDLEEEYTDMPNDTDVQKTDVESVLREHFPMINWDKLIEGIVPEVITLGDGNISFQCSDNLGEIILCSAYDDLDEHLVFTDWHNF